jgi:2,3-bisphosphoglycerate-independent phosphoglycerate mutase
MAPPRIPHALIILDGFGEAPAGPYNAVTMAKPPYFEWLRRTYPLGTLMTSGECVGLPDGLMGNSEVGHMNLGAGRIVWQDITRIDRALREGALRTNPAFVGAALHALEKGSNLHLMGLLSDGGVHASLEHVKALLATFSALGVPSERVFVHAFLDGRDTPPQSAQRYITVIEEQLTTHRLGRFATLSGRYFAMDRDNRWERVQRAYDALVKGVVSAPTAPQRAWRPPTRATRPTSSSRPRSSDLPRRAASTITTPWCSSISAPIARANSVSRSWTRSSRGSRRRPSGRGCTT